MTRVTTDMTRNAMIKAIKAFYGGQEIFDGVVLEKQPTIWLRQRMGILRQMNYHPEENSLMVSCPKTGNTETLSFCRVTKRHYPDRQDPDCIFCENF